MTRRILLVENDPGAALDIAHRLKDLNFEVLGGATSAEEVIAQALEESPDLILMNVTLSSEMDGIEAATRIHSQQNTPIIYMTMHDLNHHKTRLITSALYGYLRYPFDDETLYLVIEMALRQHGLEKQWQESEDRYQMVVREAADGILIADPQGKLQVVNEAICKSLGYTREELLGMNYRLLFLEEDLIKHPLRLDKILKGKETIKSERGIRKKNGALIQVEMHSKALSDGHFQSIVRDITDRKLTEKRIKESEMHYRQLFETTPIGIAICDMNGIILDCNSALASMLGYEHTDELRFYNDRELTASENREIESKKILEQVLTRGYTDEYEKEYLRKDGSFIPVSVRYWIRQDNAGQNVGTWIMCRDISAQKMAQTALRESEFRLKKAQEVSHTGCWELDLRTKSMWASSEAFRIYGLKMPPDQVLPLTEVQSTVIHTDRLKMDQALKDLISYQTPYNVDFYIHRADNGEQRAIHSIAELINDEQGRAIKVTGIIQDITEAKRAAEALSESEGRYRSLFTEMLDGFALHQIICDDLGNPVNYRYLEVNPAFERLIGMQSHNVIGKTVLDILPHTEMKWIERYGRVALSGIPAHFEDSHEELGKYFEVTAFSPKIGQFAVIAVDISERIGLMQTLEKERSSLAKRVEERTADLSIANMQLAKAARMKDEFLASMSHELRTPLTGILGMSEALQHQVYGEVNERQVKALNNIEESGIHLLALINDILDLSKIEAGKIEIEIRPLSLDTICQASLRLVKQNAQKKQLKIHTVLDSQIGSILGDEKRIKQILINLLSNAVKFTPDGGMIGVETRGDRRTGLIFITVWDTGIGIKKEDMSRLFMPFVQLDSSLSRQFNGTGLGLSLVFRLVELHGGSISVESEPEQGSRFTVSLPWNEAQSLPEQDVLPQSISSLPAVRRALVVEDTPADIEVLSRYLKEMQVDDIIVCTHGAVVLEKALELQPDLILLDVMLPDQNGFDLLKELKNNEKIRSIPVVMISVLDEERKGLSLGADAYLVKPVSSAQIQQTVNYLFTQRKLHKALLANVCNHCPVVLVAEDNPINLTTISDYLQIKGFEVHHASNGAEVIEKALELHPDAILMDIQMPVVDGLEATRRIRSDRRIAATPIVALTALAMSGDRERCFEAGVNEYLSKPIHLDQLYQILLTLLQHRLLPS